MKFIRRKPLAFVAALLICFTQSGFSLGTSAQKAGNHATFDERNIAACATVAETDRLVMSADENGHFEIKDKQTGHLWKSIPENFEADMVTVGINRQIFQSEIVVNYVYRDQYGGTSSYKEASISSQEALAYGGVGAYAIRDGIRVCYDFFTICAGFSVDYTIKDNILSVKLDGRSVAEGEKFRKQVKNSATEEQLGMMQDSYITSVWILPAFGVGKTGDSGFVFVPDGCGAYIKYDAASYATTFANIPVYGDDLSVDEYAVKRKDSITRADKAYFPMIGIVQNGNGMVGVIAEGEEIGSVYACKAGTTSVYTGASFSATYRIISHTMIANRYVQGLSKISGEYPSFEVAYHLIRDEQPGFSDLADYYAQMLLKQGKIKKNKSVSSVAVNVVGAVDIASHFMGIPCKKLKALTTYDQAGKIISELGREISDGISVNYLGWCNNGLQNGKMVSRADPLRILGGEKAFDALASTAEKNSAVIYLDADFQTFQKSGNGVSRLRHSCKTVFDKTALIRRFSYADFEYENEGARLLVPERFLKVFRRFIASAEKWDENFGLSFNSTASGLYSDFASKNEKSRSYLLEQYLQGFDEVNRPLSAKDAYAYTWKYAGKIFEAPSASGRKKIYDGEVPMYQMILHGLIPVTSPAINTSANRREVFLRSVETGSELCFTVMHEDSEVVNGTDYDDLYATTYESVRDSLLEMYREYGELYRLIADEKITEYRTLGADVVQTVYGNGISVFVNYSDRDYSAVEGTVVPAKGFCYRRS